MKKVSILFICAILVSLTSCKEDYPDLADGMYAEFNTNQGSFLAELYYKETPITVANFVSLAEGKSHKMVDSTYQGKKFYDGLIFHRVIRDFMIQGGDPQGTGSGDPGYRFPDEIVDSLKLDDKGVLAMANAGPGTNGSQFFVTLAATPWLNGKHTVFGKVIENQAVVDSIGTVKTGPGDKPLQEVKIESVKIIRKGNDAKNFDASKVFEEKLSKVKEEEEELAKKKAASQRANSDKFSALKENAETKELESGLKIHFLEKGDGPQPKAGDKVKIDYAGYFADGTLFDTSKEELATKVAFLTNNEKTKLDIIQW